MELARGQTQCWEALPPNLQRVKHAVQRDRATKFTALLHHVDVAALRRAFRRLKRGASPGVDGETVASYEKGLEGKLHALHARVHNGRYRPAPIRRVYIPKADGSQRPLGILILEDKVVQGAVAEVLSVIYEVDFVDNSYGFRPGRGPHDALKAVQRAILSQPVNYVLDADIRRFFDSVDHEQMLRALRVRIADKRILRMIEQWLQAEVLESGEGRPSEVGTPQGAAISPLLANIFLHYALDKWVGRWQAQEGRGPMIYVRYADDFIMGFQRKGDGLQMLADLRERLGRCGLVLHEGKTRLIEFGRFAARSRAKRGQRRPETFDFLGFTHYCDETRKGMFMVKRRTQGQRFGRKLKELRQEARWRMHQPVRLQHRWLVRVLQGHYNYYGLPGNSGMLYRFHARVLQMWKWVLNRRGGKRWMSWVRFRKLLETFPLPRPCDLHPSRTATEAVR